MSTVGPERGRHCGCTALTNERDVYATRRKRSALCGPAQAVLEDPSIERVLLLLGEAQAGVSDALKNVVVVLRRAEHRWRRVRHIPAVLMLA